MKLSVDADRINNPVECFHFLSHIPEDIQIPEKFNFPFCYEPNAISILAVEELKHHIQHQLETEHDFGRSIGTGGLGKMFGILVVMDKNNNIGYLRAFSGKLDGGHDYPGFVPPVFDTLDENGFYRLGEEEINIVTKQITSLECETRFKELHNKLQCFLTESYSEIENLKAEFGEARKLRQEKRSQPNPNSSDRNDVDQKLNQESIRQHYILKDRKRYWKKTIDDLKDQLKSFEQNINSLKEQRKKMSATLQQRLFQNYTFLNHFGLSKSLIDIFNITDDKTPPSGAGECAAPKLLQFAYKNGFTPIAMAEFWWGKSPSSEIRRHGYFYPACNSKCKPILNHMLEGLSVDKNPMAEEKTLKKDLPILFEDAYIVAINKPVDFLSVPGKVDRPSVFGMMKEKYPEATGPLIVHRLDMSTSGIMLIAKSKEVHQHLQSQFIKRKIKKRYVAILDGVVTEDEGTINLPMRVDLDDRPRQVICFQYGKPANTYWQVAERNDYATRIHFFPVTGRTHQLRVHASHALGLNIPIKGDDLYGKRDKRLYLHAEKLEFLHPIKKEEITIVCEPEF